MSKNHRQSSDVTVRYFFEGETERAAVSLADGTEAIWTAYLWRLRMICGASPCLSFDDNGDGDLVLGAHLWDHEGTRNPHHDAPREVMAFRMLEEEALGGPKADSKGWVARLIDRDPRNLRHENVRWDKLKGRRGSNFAVRTARWRLLQVERLRAEGVPDEEIPERIRALIAAIRKGSPRGEK